MSSPRGRRQAALPDAGFTRPSPIDESGLVFTVFGESGGVEGVVSFAAMAGGAELRRAIVRGFERVCGPGRRWRSVTSARNASKAIGSLLAFGCSRGDVLDMPRHLAPDLLSAWAESLGPGPWERKNVGLVRKVLLCVEGVPPGAGVALRRQVHSAREESRPAGYGLEEFEAIRSTAAAVFNTALVRIRSNRRHLARWYAGQFAEGTIDYLRGEALDCILRTGDAPRYPSASGTGRITLPHQRALGGDAMSLTRNELYLGGEELFALQLLLVASEAWNRSVIEAMQVPEHDPAAADDFDIHMVEIDKRRRPVRLRRTSNNLVDDGPESAGRLMGRAIEATELARQTLDLLGLPTKALLVYRCASNRSNLRGFGLGIPKMGSASFRDRVGLKDADGNLRQITLQPTRRTVQVRITKAPAQNSRRTHESVYVLRDASTPQAVAGTIAQGLNNALEHARTMTTMKMLLGGDSDVLLELADHPQLARAVIAGSMDTATAACTDFTHSPHGEPGEPCPASFLLCLSCPNAIATPRHLPRLAYLHACLESLRATLEAVVWELDWLEHHVRIDSLLQTHTSEPERRDALRRLTDRDKTLIDDLLARRLEA